MAVACMIYCTDVVAAGVKKQKTIQIFLSLLKKIRCHHNVIIVNIIFTHKQRA